MWYLDKCLNGQNWQNPTNFNSLCFGIWCICFNRNGERQGRQLKTQGGISKVGNCRYISIWKVHLWIISVMEISMQTWYIYIIYHCDTKFVLKIKRKQDFTINKYKARIMARGFLQRYNLDYKDMHSPVTENATFKLLYTRCQ